MCKSSHNIVKLQGNNLPESITVAMYVAIVWEDIELYKLYIVSVTYIRINTNIVCIFTGLCICLYNSTY